MRSAHTRSSGTRQVGGTAVAYSQRRTKCRKGSTQKMPTAKTIARKLAGHLVNGPWISTERTKRAGEVLGGVPAWLTRVLERLATAFPSTARPTRKRVTSFLLNDDLFLQACHHPKKRLTVRYLTTSSPTMYPAYGNPQTWPVPPLVTPGELADWLGISVPHLDWFANLQDRSRELPPGPRHHYLYHWMSKRRAGSARLIESPKWRLKQIQRRILHDILDRIPPHAAAHGFRPEHSVLTFVSAHLQQEVVVRLDLRNFFPSIPWRRVHGVFLTAGYPGDIATYLAALCTNRAPACVWKDFPQYGSHEDRLAHESLYGRAHLPQGAPTSPALANLAAYQLDCRLHGLAKACGAVYSRYADDLLFSGDAEFASRVRRFLPHVEAIILEEGFSPHPHKTRIMHESQRQSAGGLVLNQRVNLPRRDYDCLKATLFNCVQRGPATENRDQRPNFHAHLTGRVTYVEMVNPARGRSLRRLLSQIRWPDEMERS